jgi:hypothetical protein
MSAVFMAAASVSFDGDRSSYTKGHNTDSLGG